MSTNELTKVYVRDEDVAWEQVGEGIKRKIMAYDDRVMMVKVDFEKGGIGAVHQHHHTQITHVDSGVFEVEIDGEKQILKKGDVFFIPSNVWHGAVCLEAGVLIDVFSPMREDFIK
jgi:quercetin dioxygenase-like cupin family protein